MQILIVREKLSAWRRHHPLASFLAGRGLTALILLYLLGYAVFGLMALAPGDIVERFVKSQMFMSEDTKQLDNIYSPEAIAAFKAQLGLDKPFWEQYHAWLGRLFGEGDLGRTLLTRAPVTFVIRDRLLNSLALNLISLVLLTTTSWFLGIYFSTKAGTKLDLGVGFLSLILNAFPGLLLMILLQLWGAATGWFPVTAYPSVPFDQDPPRFVFSYLHHIVLPLLTAFLGGIGGTLRTIRATMLDQFGQPYITALRSRGLSEGRLTFAHAFRNTLNPYITGSANLLAGLFSGSLILEIVFAYPGMGRLMYEAVVSEDINLVVSNMMFISALVLAGMILSDLALALVDPRIRYARGAA